MNALLKRIEKLEAANRPAPEVEALRIIRMVFAPSEGLVSALCGSAQIDRHEGEACETFRQRAAATFNRMFRGPCAESVDCDEDI